MCLLENQASFVIAHCQLVITDKYDSDRLIISSLDNTP
jgi:hypothetical protein